MPQELAVFLSVIEESSTCNKNVASLTFVSYAFNEMKITVAIFLFTCKVTTVKKKSEKLDLHLRIDQV